jgi:hypothetical protein
MNLSDYIPHGMVTAFAGVITFIYRDHVKQDDFRFGKVTDELAKICSRQTEISDRMAENHAEILRTLLTSSEQRATNAALDRQV